MAMRMSPHRGAREHINISQYLHETPPPREWTEPERRGPKVQEKVLSDLGLWLKKCGLDFWTLFVDDETVGHRNAA